MPRATVSGLCHQFKENDNSSATKKAVENSDGGKEVLKATSITGKKIASLVGTASSMALGIPPAPLIHSTGHYIQLQQVKNAAIHGPLGLTRCTDTDIPTLERGASVVGGASSLMELSITLSTQEEPQDSNTSIQDGLGCLLPGRKSRGNVVIRVNEVSHKLSGTPGCLSSDPTFVKHKTNLMVYLQLYTVTAQSYINKKGGTLSFSLSQLAKQAWSWCMEREISLIADHILGKENMIADSESQVFKDRWDWKLNPELFRIIQQKLVLWRRIY